VGTWLVHVPDAHPWWEWWVVGVVHLREMTGVPEAKLAYDGAEYEFTIITVDPDRCPTPDPDLVDEGYEFLLPPDVCEQFHGVNDVDATRIGEMAVTAIVAGKISPDEDFRPAWRERLSKTVLDFVAGRHALN